MTKRLLIPSTVQPHQCFATYTKDLPTLTNIPIFDETPVLDFGLKSTNYDLTEQMKDLIKQQGLYATSKKGESFYLLEPINLPYNCAICEKEHISDVGKHAVFIRPDILTFKCFRNNAGTPLAIKVPKLIE